MFKDVAAVLFDLDGTLIDSAPDLGAAADKMRVDRGLPSLPLDRYRPMAGAGARGMLGIAFGMGVDHPDYGELREEFFKNYENCMTQRTAIFKDVPELIDQLGAAVLVDVLLEQRRILDRVQVGVDHRVVELRLDGDGTGLLCTS